MLFRKEVVDSLFTYSAMAYPREGILLLRGKVKKGVAEVTGVVVPPMAEHGAAFSSFNWWMLPVDLSYLGVAHSHPSGNHNPSHEDLLHVTGRIMVIMGYPYATVDNLGVYDHNGNRVPFEVSEGTRA
ncbi:MAG: Mov34/MPN/PAD-1 family protein [Nitrososphaerota archaeon]|nr:Mov34/MPN/PAD-1 family protein [Nitrososphaerota archaeon]